MGGSAKARHEERWTSTKKERVLYHPFSSKASGSLCRIEVRD